jgi:hypothetical protein
VVTQLTPEQIQAAIATVRTAQNVESPNAAYDPGALEFAAAARVLADATEQQPEPVSDAEACEALHWAFVLSSGFYTDRIVAHLADRGFAVTRKAGAQ